MANHLRTMPRGLQKLRKRMHQFGHGSVTLGEIRKYWKEDRSHKRRENWEKLTLLPEGKRKAALNLIIQELADNYNKPPVNYRLDYKLLLAMQINPRHFWWSENRLVEFDSEVVKLTRPALERGEPFVVWGTLSVLGWHLISKHTFDLEHAIKRFRKTVQSEGHHTFALLGAVDDHLREANCHRCETREDAFRHLHKRYMGWLNSHQKSLLDLAPLILTRVRESVERCKAAERANKGRTEVLDVRPQCAFIRLINLSGLERLRFDYDRSLTTGVEETGEYLDSLEYELKILAWNPGRAFDSRPLKEDYIDRPMMPWDHYRAATQIDDILYRARGTARKAISPPWKFEFDCLMRRVAPWGYSAWRSVRSIRIAELKEKDASRDYKMRLGELALFADEVSKHERAAQALKDAGDFLGAAALAAELIRVIPDKLLDSSQFGGYYRKLATRVGHSVRQAGFEFDDRDGRLARPKVPRYKSQDCEGEIVVEVLDDEEQDLDGAALGEIDRAEHCRVAKMSLYDNGDAPDDTVKDPSRVRLEWEKTTCEKLKQFWSKILQHPEFAAQRDPIGAAVYYLRSPELLPQHRDELLRPVFLLCLRYGYLDDAAHLLKRFRADDGVVPDDVFTFAHEVKRASQIVPFGIDVEVYQHWQTSLRYGLSLLHEKEWAENSVTDLLTVHEMLLGRGLSIIQNSAKLKRLLAEKLASRLSDEDARAVFAARADIRERGPATVAPKRILNVIKGLSCGSFGSPTCVSLTRLADNDWGLLIADKDGFQRPERIRITGVFEAVRNLCDALPANIQYRKSVPWPRAFKKLGKQIVDKVLGLGSKSRWILLAIEPKLAVVPWQDLISIYAKARGTRLLTSLIPNFGWLEKAFHDPNEYSDDIDPIISTFDELIRPYAELYANSPEKLKKAHAEMERLYERIVEDCEHKTLDKRWGSIALAVGHGTYDVAERFPTIVAPERPITRERWMDLSEIARILLIQSCYGGQVQREMLGDLGGIPGLALGLGCRLVCAPVSEAPPEAALALHESLVREHGPQTFGERYVQAIESGNSFVSLYNLYGLPSECAKTSPVAE